MVSNSGVKSVAGDLHECQRQRLSSTRCSKQYLMSSGGEVLLSSQNLSTIANASGSEYEQEMNTRRRSLSLKDSVVKKERFQCQRPNSFPQTGPAPGLTEGVKPLLAWLQTSEQYNGSIRTNEAVLQPNNSEDEPPAEEEQLPHHQQQQRPAMITAGSLPLPSTSRTSSNSEQRTAVKPQLLRISRSCKVHPAVQQRQPKIQISGSRSNGKDPMSYDTLNSHPRPPRPGKHQTSLVIAPRQDGTLNLRQALGLTKDFDLLIAAGMDQHDEAESRPWYTKIETECMMPLPSLTNRTPAVLDVLAAAGAQPDEVATGTAVVLGIENNPGGPAASKTRMLLPRTNGMTDMCVGSLQRPSLQEDEGAVANNWMYRLERPPTPHPSDRKNRSAVRRGRATWSGSKNEECEPPHRTVASSKLRESYQCQSALPSVNVDHLFPSDKRKPVPSTSGSHQGQSSSGSVLRRSVGGSLAASSNKQYNDDDCMSESCLVGSSCSNGCHHKHGKQSTIHAGGQSIGNPYLAGLSEVESSPKIAVTSCCIGGYSFLRKRGPNLKPHSDFEFDKLSFKSERLSGGPRRAATSIKDPDSVERNSLAQ